MTEHRRWPLTKQFGVLVSSFVPLAFFASVGCQVPWFGAQQTRNDQAALDLLQSPASPLNRDPGDRSANKRHGILSGTRQDSLSQPSASSRMPQKEAELDTESSDSNGNEFSLDDLDSKTQRTLQSQWRAATGRDLQTDLIQEAPQPAIRPTSSRKLKSQPDSQLSADEEEPVSMSFSDSDDAPAEPPSTDEPVTETENEANRNRGPQKTISNWKYGNPNRNTPARVQDQELSSRKKVTTSNNIKQLSDTSYREPKVKAASAERSQEPSQSELPPPTTSALPNSTSQQLRGKAEENEASELMREALQSISAQLSNETATGSDQRLRLEIHKRLLNLMLGDLDAAMESIESLQSHEQDFYKHLLQALHDVGDPGGNPVRSRRNTLALASMRKSLAHLAAASNLEVHNATFCSKVDGFGVIEKFAQYHFRPEQEVLLYCELDNFVSDQVTDGYETKLQGSYEIVNSDGRRVADQTLPMDAHVCRNQRRDYFIAYRLYMPRSIEQGKHNLRLTIEDLKGQKYGQTSLEFHIVK